MAKELIEKYRVGLITLTELMNSLEAIQVRGAFRINGDYVGYDYANQQWVEV